MRKPGMRRVELQAAAGTSVGVFRQGATVNTDDEIDFFQQDVVEIPVYDTARIVVGDSLQIDTDDTTEMQVTAVAADGNSLTVQGMSDSTFRLIRGTRLVVVSPRPALYNDAFAGWPMSGPYVTIPSSGYAGFYCAETRVDLIFTKQGSPTLLFMDRIAGWAWEGLGWFNALQYPDLQSAVDAVPPGGTLFIPAGDYTVPSGGLIVSKGLALQGEQGTRLFSYAATSNQPVIKLAPNGTILPCVTLRDLALLNASQPSSPVSGNYGLQGDVASDGSKVAFLSLDNISIVNMGDDGVHLHALGASDSFFVFVSMQSVQIIGNRGRGLFASYVNLLHCHGCHFNHNDLDGMRADNSEVAFYACAFEGNCTSSDTSRIDATFDGQAYLRTCLISRFDGCHFEDFTGSGHPVNKRALMIENSPCSIVSGCHFCSASEDTSSSERGIVCTYGDEPGVLACAILPNVFTNVHTAIEVDAGSGAALDCVVFPQHVQSGSAAMMLPTALSDSGLVLLGNRKLGSSGSARGVFLPPRENTSSNPLPSLTGDDAGYTLYDMTSGSTRIWNGSQWVLVQAV